MMACGRHAPWLVNKAAGGGGVNIAVDGGVRKRNAEMTARNAKKRSSIDTASLAGSD
jgi:hypothetical protein